MLECPGVFTVPFVPKEWTATAKKDMTFFELQPATKDAAVHISVHHRSAPSALQPGQAEAFLRRFMNAEPVEGNPQLVTLPQDGDEQRAFAKYRYRDAEGRLSEWFAGCILWPTTMLMCSCNAAPGSQRLDEGERMIASIFRGSTDD